MNHHKILDDKINFLDKLKSNNRCRTFIIAEAGVHHDCSINKAKMLIDAAAAAGADAVKFQTYKADTLVTVWAPKYWLENQKTQEETQFEYFKKRDKFNFADYQELRDYALGKGIIFCSTPFDDQSVRWLNKLDIPFWKVASADLDNYPLLEEIAITKKPVILSTGAAYFEEIRGTVNFLKSKGINELALLHCNLSYPTPNNQTNLLRIVKLKELFPNLPIGYSDHTIPDEHVVIPAIAVGLGARIIEKHFTLDPTAPEDDHYHAVDPVLLKQMIDNIKIAEETTSKLEEITHSEQPARSNARRSLVCSVDITRGTIIEKSMLIPKRPAGGISPSLINIILGRRVKANIKKDQQITLDLLE